MKEAEKPLIARNYEKNLCTHTRKRSKLPYIATVKSQLQFDTCRLCKNRLLIVRSHPILRLLPQNKPLSRPIINSRFQKITSLRASAVRFWNFYPPKSLVCRPGCASLKVRRNCSRSVLLIGRSWHSTNFSPVTFRFFIRFSFATPCIEVRSPTSATQNIPI